MKVVECDTLKDARCTISRDDVIALIDANGEEFFRQHQPGAYALVIRDAARGISIGYRDGKVADVCLVEEKRP